MLADSAGYALIVSSVIIGSQCKETKNAGSRDETVTFHRNSLSGTSQEAQE